MSTKAKFNCQDIRLTGRFERKLDELINGRRSAERHSHFRDTQKTRCALLIAGGAAHSVPSRLCRDAAKETSRYYLTAAYLDPTTTLLLQKETLRLFCGEILTSSILQTGMWPIIKRKDNGTAVLPGDVPREQRFNYFCFGISRRRSYPEFSDSLKNGREEFGEVLGAVQGTRRRMK